MERGATVRWFSLLGSDEPPPAAWAGAGPFSVRAVATSEEAPRPRASSMRSAAWRRSEAQKRPSVIRPPFEAATPNGLTPGANSAACENTV